MDPLAEKAQIEAQSKLDKISRRLRHVTKSKQEKIKADFGWRKDRSYIHPDGLYVMKASSDATALPDGKSATASDGVLEKG